MDLTEKTIESVNVFKGVVVDLYVDTVVLPDGTTAKREVINHPGGVCILAVDENLDVLIVKQFRKAPDGVMTEIPAGKLEYGEEPLQAGIRELEEETGAKAREIIPLGFFYPTPAYCKEKIYMYLAKGLTFGSQHTDEGEFLEVERIPYKQLYEMVLNNEITDGKTALAVLKARKYISEEI